MVLGFNAAFQFYSLASGRHFTGGMRIFRGWSFRSRFPRRSQCHAMVFRPGT